MPFDGWYLSDLDGVPEVDPDLKRYAGLRLVQDAELILRAREDPNAFVEACGRIEGGAWVGVQAPVHRMWQDFLTAASKSARASTACLLAPVGHAKTVAEGETVETPHGPVAIERLRVGDWILCPDPRTYTVRTAQVSRLWPRVDKPIRRLTTAGGREFEAAVTHPVWIAGDGRVGWRPTAEIEPGAGALALDRGTGRLAWDPIVDVADLGTGPCYDIEVDAPEHAYIAGGLAVHNSTQIHRWRVIWELGKNPNLRVALIGETQLLPGKMLRGIVADIEGNPFVQAVFPHLRRSRRAGQDKWNEEEIYVARDANLPDASIRVYSVNSPVLGSRFDLMVFDDVVSIENTLTGYMRRKVWDTIRAQFLSRRPPTELGPSRVWFLGHVWYEDDTIAEACRLPGSSVLRQGARVQRLPEEALKADVAAAKAEKAKPRGRIITSSDPEWDESLGWSPLAPMLVDKAELSKKYTELGWGSGHMLDNRFIRKSGTGFSEELLLNALRAGVGLPFTGAECADQNTWNPISTQAETFTGVDLSTGEGDDETVIFTVAVMPGRGTRRLLCIESGKWEGPEIRDKIVETYRRYQSTIAVESNASQRFIRQFVHEAHVVSVTDHETSGQAKHHLKWGIRQMAMELADPCRWQFPRPADATRRADPQIRKLLYDAIHYSPERHAGDHLMAWWICWLQIVKATGEWSK